MFAEMQNWALEQYVEKLKTDSGGENNEN